MKAKDFKMLKTIAKETQMPLSIVILVNKILISK